MHSAVELEFRSLHKGREEKERLWMKESAPLSWAPSSEQSVTRWATLCVATEEVSLPPPHLPTAHS